IEGPGQPSHIAGMSFQRRTTGIRFYVPELDRLVRTAAGEEARIRSEDQFVDLVAVTMQFFPQRPLVGVPQPNDGIYTATRKQAPIAAPGECQNLAALGVKTRQWCPGSQIPKVNGSIITPTHQLPV